MVKSFLLLCFRLAIVLYLCLLLEDLFQFRLSAVDVSLQSVGHFLLRSHASRLGRLDETLRADLMKGLYLGSGRHGGSRAVCQR